MKVALATLLILGSVIAHFIAMYTGVYDAQMRQGVVWFDNVLHAIVGIAFGLVWLAILRRWRPESGMLYTSATVLGFVFAVAIMWELFELVFYLVFKSGALGLKVYSPSLNEAIFDSLSNLFGGALLLVLFSFKNTNVKER
jgi:hypothetical protein